MIAAPAAVEAAWLRSLCLEAGADDVGFVELEHRAVDADRADILAAFPRTRTLISLVARLHREPIRSPARSIANLEFHQSGDRLNAITRRIVGALDRHGVAAVNPAMAFPMEMSGSARKTWIVSHKTVAVAAGLGQIGIHRNVIHPRFGSFVLLGTVMIDAEVSVQGRAIDFNPCVECKLCVAACPVGAIGADGHFDFAACYTHNYREFMGGFSDWVEVVAESDGRAAYRAAVSDAETFSVWQSLAYGPNYKAAYCVAVCPAGAEVIPPFLGDRAAYLTAVVRPLQDKAESVYVVPGSDAEAHVVRRFPGKTPRRVRNGLRARTIDDFIGNLPLVFQRGRAKGLKATYHFTFTGDEPAEATVVIDQQTLSVRRGLAGTASLCLTADSRTWLRFLSGEAHLAVALLRRKIRLRGSAKLLIAFGKCFP